MTTGTTALRSLWQRLKRQAPRLWVALATVALWIQTVEAFAQRRKAEPEAAPAGKSYVIPYMVVVLCIALGLVVVCRSGNRSKEPKLDNLE